MSTIMIAVFHPRDENIALPPEAVEDWSALSNGGFEKDK
jgi:hypothetical protein